MADKKYEPAYATRLCPLLTGATYAKAEAPRIQALGANVQAPAGTFTPVTCRGPACMWFVASQDEAGNVDGACAIAAQFQGLQQIAGLVVETAAAQGVDLTKREG